MRVSHKPYAHFSKGVVAFVSIAVMGIVLAAGRYRPSKCPLRSDRAATIKPCCAKIDEAARNCMALLVPEPAKRNGVTERLKAENQMEWVRQMNACKAQAEEIVKIELIYD